MAEKQVVLVTVRRTVTEESVVGVRVDALLPAEAAIALAIDKMNVSLGDVESRRYLKVVDAAEVVDEEEWGVLRSQAEGGEFVKAPELGDMLVHQGVEWQYVGNLNAPVAGCDRVIYCPDLAGVDGGHGAFSVCTLDTLEKMRPASGIVVGYNFSDVPQVGRHSCVAGENIEAGDTVSLMPDPSHLVGRRVAIKVNAVREASPPSVGDDVVFEHARFRVSFGPDSVGKYQLTGHVTGGAFWLDKSILDGLEVVARG